MTVLSLARARLSSTKHKRALALFLLHYHFDTLLANLHYGDGAWLQVGIHLSLTSIADRRAGLCTVDGIDADGRAVVHTLNAQHASLTLHQHGVSLHTRHAAGNAFRLRLP